MKLRNKQEHILTNETIYCYFNKLKMLNKLFITNSTLSNIRFWTISFQTEWTNTHISLKKYGRLSTLKLTRLCTSLKKISVSVKNSI